MTLTPGGPGGKYLGRTAPLTAAELREVLAEVIDQVDREPEVLAALSEAILSRDLTTTAEILTHLRDLFGVVGAALRAVKVTDGSEPS